MKKTLNKILDIFLALFISFSMFSVAFANNSKTSLNIIQQASETKYLENDQGYISKTIVDSNASTGEVTIELKLSNTKEETEASNKYEDTEIYIMISENIVNDEEILEKNLNNISYLAQEILNLDSNIKIGIIGITGTVSNVIENEDGSATFGDNDEVNVEGTEANAEIVVNPTNNVETILNGIKNMNSSKTEYRTNLQAAIRLANKSYSNNVNKILISLYDNVPSIAIGVMSGTSYGGWNSAYSTAEEAIKAKHENIATYTRNEILTLKTSNVQFFLLRPDDTSYDETWYNTNTGKKVLEFDGSPYVQKLYGTIDNPTYGKMYSFDEDSIDTIIKENIYQDVKQIIQQDINTVQIVDYFPSDIVDNFEFSYVGNPSVGTVSEDIDSKTNTITWEIGTLKGNEVATLKYKLKIKDMQNTELLNKTISTNEKVVLTYKDTDSKDYTVTLTSSPKIQLSEVKEDVNETSKNNGNDTTTATGTLPQTGVGIGLGVTIICLIGVGIIIYFKNNKIKDI
jgi:hypothetical protein